jgi:type II secretory pathway component PulK
LMRSEGGKAPRPPGPRRILQTSEPVRQIPGTPEAQYLKMIPNACALSYTSR